MFFFSAIQKERLGCLEEIVKKISTIKSSFRKDITKNVGSNNDNNSLSTWKKLKLRFSSRYQRRQERKKSCILLNEALKNLANAMFQVAVINEKLI